MIAVLDNNGKEIINAVIETKAEMLSTFISNFTGDIHLTFEEGTQANWLFEVLSPLVSKLIVCDPRRNSLLLEGNKSDRIDAGKLAVLLRAGLLIPTYHAENKNQLLKEVVRCYDCLIQDVTRVKNRIKAVFRGRGIGCAGDKVYQPENREQFLQMLKHEGLSFRVRKVLSKMDYLEQLA